MPRTYSDKELLDWLDRFDVIALLMSLPPRTQFIEFECGGVGEVDGPRVSFREQLIKTIEASPAAATQSGSSGSEGEEGMRELVWTEVEDGKWKADDPPYVWNMLRIRSDEYRFYCDTDFKGFGTCFRDAAQNADAMRMFPSPFPRTVAPQPSLDEQKREILRTGEWPPSLMVETKTTDSPTWIENTEGPYRTWIQLPPGSDVVLHVIEITTERYEFYRAGNFIGWSTSLDAAKGHLERGEIKDVMLSPALTPHWEQLSQPVTELFTLAGQTIFQISGANGAPALQWESYPLVVPLCVGGLTTREYASHPDLCRGFALDRAHAIQRTMEEFEAEQWTLRGRPGTPPVRLHPIMR